LAAALQPADIAPLTSASAQSSSHILLVEDNPVNQEVARGMLEFLGYQVDIVESGRTAVQATEHILYDLVFMDCQMPDLDGFEATQAIREKEASAIPPRPRLPIIALTADTTADARNSCIAAGMDDYLGKPYSQEQLHEVLDRWLAGPGAGAERLLSSDGEEQCGPQ
jgi:CheY-like chemotaxis protein